MLKRIFISWVCSAVSLLIVAQLIPGFTVRGIVPALIAAVVIAIVNGTIGTVLKILAFPITILTLGLAALIINALLLMFSANLVSGFHVAGFIPALIGSIALSIINAILGMIFKD